MRITSNIGMLLLAIYLIILGATSFIAIPIAPAVLGVLALVSGIFLLIGR